MITVYATHPFAKERDLVLTGEKIAISESLGRRWVIVGGPDAEDQVDESLVYRISHGQDAETEEEPLEYLAGMEASLEDRPWSEYLIYDEEVSEYSPVVIGTDVTAADILSLLTEGHGPQEIADAYDGVAVADVRAVGRYYQDIETLNFEKEWQESLEDGIEDEEAEEEEEDEEGEAEE